MEIPYDAPKFSLQGTHTVRVVSIHDGDTITCVIPFETSFYKFSIRLAGIDTCEMTSKNNLARAKAFLARGRLFQLITDTNIDTLEWRKRDFDDYFAKYYTTITLECTEMDKYGRVLANISNFADILVHEKLAYRYDGGKKLTEQEFFQSLLA